MLSLWRAYELLECDFVVVYWDYALKWDGNGLQAFFCFCLVCLFAGFRLLAELSPPSLRGTNSFAEWQIIFLWAMESEAKITIAWRGYNEAERMRLIFGVVKWVEKWGDSGKVGKVGFWGKVGN